VLRINIIEGRLKKMFNKAHVQSSLLELVQKAKNQVKIATVAVRYKNPLRNAWIRKKQSMMIEKQFSPDADRLILFLVPGFNMVNGGVLSISSVCNETKLFGSLHQSAVVMCTVPGHPLLLRYTKFRNDHSLYSLSSALFYFKNAKRVLIHVPEFAVDRFINYLYLNNHFILSRGIKLHTNIMLQNIELAPPLASVDILKKYGVVSCTTAHEAYTNSLTEKRIGCPVHKLSVYVSPEQYLALSYEKKENLMIVSPDPHAAKDAILRRIQDQSPGLRIKIIKNLSYEEYKGLVSRAKWALTFGEGLDGYFVETIFSGGISFAVYNTKYFTKDFKILATVYPDYATLMKGIGGDMSALDNPCKYHSYQMQQYEVCKKHYNFRYYIENLERFYRYYYKNDTDALCLSGM
jgi:hypothetical protein